MFGKFLKSRVLSIPMVDVTRVPLLADSGSSSIKQQSAWIAHRVLSRWNLPPYHVWLSGLQRSAHISPSVLFCSSDRDLSFQDGGRLPPEGPPLLQNLVACQTCFSFNSGGLSGV